MKSALQALIIVFIGLVFYVSAAQAQTSRLYFAGYMGLSTHTESDFSESTTALHGDVEFKNAFSIAGALGLRLTPQWRLEGEISYRKADMDRVDISNLGSFELGGDLKTYLYLLNMYYDINFDWKNFQPFLTAGIGLASHEAQIDDLSGNLVDAGDDSMGFAWALGGGLKYRVNPDVALSTNYRYIGTNDLETDSYDVEYTNHEFRLGIEYDLPTDWADSLFQ